MLDPSTTSPQDASSLLSSESPSRLLSLGELVAEMDANENGRETVLEALLTATSGERAFLVHFDPAEESWRVLAARTFDGEEILNPEEKIIATLLDRCRERRAGYFTPDLESEPIFDQIRRSRQPRTRSLLVVAFPEPETMIYIDHRFRGLELGDDGDLERAWLTTLLVATESMRAHREERDALESQLRDARRALKERRSSIPAEAAPRSPNRAEDDGRGLRGNFAAIIGQSPEILEILELLDRIAPTNAPILINGESGTGKELIALGIHTNSLRSEGPFVSENCGALTETLLESELFGYTKGAFTGAYEDREGLFEVASGGTLFLDEIGDTSPGMQKKLLRVLQEGKIRRVGGAELVKVDVRIVSATNKDLMTEVHAGRFREDLYYRLNVIGVLLPPLRDRREDLPLLAEHFVAQLNEESGMTKTLTPEVLSRLARHTWPGNIRELQNEVRRIYTLSGDRLSAEMLSPRVVDPPSASDGGALPNLDAVLEHGSLKDATEELEKRILAASLKRFHGNKALICAQLKIPKTTLYSKLKRYRLDDGGSRD